MAGRRVYLPQDAIRVGRAEAKLSLLNINVRKEDAIRVGRAEAKSGIVHLATFKSDAIRVGRAEAKCPILIEINEKP